MSSHGGVVMADTDFVHTEARLFSLASLGKAKLVEACGWLHAHGESHAERSAELQGSILLAFGPLSVLHLPCLTS